MKRSGKADPKVGEPGRVEVVGAGPVGLGMADALRKAGISYDQVDAFEGIRGNWRHGVCSHASGPTGQLRSTFRRRSSIAEPQNGAVASAAGHS